MRKTLASVWTVSLGAALLAAAGCGQGTGVTKPGAAGPINGAAILELEYEDVEVAPGASKQVKVVGGEAVAVAAPRNCGVNAKLTGDTVTVWADKSARRGRRTVTVKGRGQETTFTVSIGMNVTQRAARA
jgi:hypothetical protein